MCLQKFLYYFGSADILKTDIPALVREKFGGLTPIVCANLPYNITTPAITALIE